MSTFGNSTYNEACNYRRKIMSARIERKLIEYKRPTTLEKNMSISIWTNEHPLDAVVLSHDHMSAMVLNHEQQIKDIAAHLLELKQSMFKPGMSLTEFNPEHINMSKPIPVAWIWEEAKYIETDVRGRCWSPMIGRMHPMNPQMTRNIVPLYTKLKEKNGG